MLQCEERAASRDDRRRESSPRRERPGGEPERGSIHERHAGPQRVARALGWFSIAVGLTELAAPQATARAIGLANGARIASTGSAWILRLLGLRELATGFGILARRRPAGWLWARVAGDLVDLSLLGAVRSGAAEPARMAAAATAVAGVTVVDFLCGQRLGAPRSVASKRLGDGTVRLASIVTVNRPPAECYGFWRRPQNLPRVLRHVDSVRETGEGRSHWRLRAPAGRSIEWEAELVEDQPNELIAWRSVEGSELTSDAVLRFLPGPKGDGTVVRATLRYKPSPGPSAAALRLLFGTSAAAELKQDLRRFKQVLETGQILTTRGQPHGPARLSLTRALSRS
jgi:uncharacterized membrane protein